MDPTLAQKTECNVIRFCNNCKYRAEGIHIDGCFEPILVADNEGVMPEIYNAMENFCYGKHFQPKKVSDEPGRI